HGRFLGFGHGGLLNVRDFARRRGPVLSDRCFRKTQRLNFRLEGRGEIYPRQADARITLQKLPRVKCGSLSASTSAFTLPNVVSGLCLLPSQNAWMISSLKWSVRGC